ncbi:UrcA family protein [Sphingomonas edaphi]|uniref:UrcA family protein n=1 Tax=Sphingomonas edaphi TaxID=2315689 RepID=A0A418PYT7_9SPHN|nr:UrcA family protein [Sphingomonas edaphi]RIX27232.1 UrcA family protein [Sphingomonas edaphi]
MTKLIPALLIVLAPLPLAAQPVEAVTSTVQTADLDLSSKSGQRTLDRRLFQAIAEVCGTASPSDLAGQNKVRACRSDARGRFAPERDQRIAAASGQPIEVAAR